MGDYPNALGILCGVSILYVFSRSLGRALCVRGFFSLYICCRGFGGMRSALSVRAIYDACGGAFECMGRVFKTPRGLSALDAFPPGIMLRQINRRAV